MTRKILSRISPASVVAMLALFIALGGISYAAAGKIGTADIKNAAVTKAKIKKEAVTTAKIKKNAVTGAKVKESSLATVPDAAKLGGREPAAFESKGTDTAEVAFVNLPKSSTTTVASQALPAGTYLLLGRGGINNNGGEPTGVGQRCSLTAGGTSQTIQFGALAKNTEPGDRDEFSLQLVAVLPAAGEAVLSCQTNSSWSTGNVTDPSIVAVSLQP